MKIDEIKRILIENKKKIEKEFKTKIVGIFGSYVLGKQKEGSDIDILVKFEDRATLFDLVRLGRFLEETLNLKVDIVPVDTIREEIKENILKETIYL